MVASIIIIIKWSLRGRLQVGRITLIGQRLQCCAEGLVVIEGFVIAREHQVMRLYPT